MLLRDLEQKIVKVINESGLPIDAIYFIMKSLMAEIEQRYNEYCGMEDAEVAQQSVEPDNNNNNNNEESGSKENEPVSAN